jgi:hypothetical protein
VVTCGLSKVSRWGPGDTSASKTAKTPPSTLQV